MKVTELCFDANNDRFGIAISETTTPDEIQSALDKVNYEDYDYDWESIMKENLPKDVTVIFEEDISKLYIV